MNFTDAAADASAGKRTLEVRFPAEAERAYALAYLAVPLVALVGLPRKFASTIVIPIPLAAWLIWRATRGLLDHRLHWAAAASERRNLASDVT